jgi:hypothetical protein
LPRILRHLEECGYVSRQQVRDEQRRIAATVYTVFETLVVPGPENPAPAGPDPADPPSDQPEPANAPLPSNHYTKKTDHKITTTTEAGTDSLTGTGVGCGGDWEVNLVFPAELSSAEISEARRWPICVDCPSARNRVRLRRRWRSTWRPDGSGDSATRQRFDMPMCSGHPCRPLTRTIQLRGAWCRSGRWPRRNGTTMVSFHDVRAAGGRVGRHSKFPVPHLV